MRFSNTPIEQQLLETAAGQAVYDSLVQANVDLRSVPLEMVKQMLVAECRHRKALAAQECKVTALAFC